MDHKKSIASFEPVSFKGSKDGKRIKVFNLENSSNTQISITNYGGRIVRWLTPDRNGNIDDIVLGFDNLGKYFSANEKYYGALIGRYANRIDEGQFSLNGTTHTLARNDGQNHLHGGPGGFDSVVWEADQLDRQCLRLEYYSEDGEEGYPGNLQVKVIYTLNDSNELIIDYTATTDQPTIVNFTSHSFFNLSGAASGKINEHQLFINADKYTPIDAAHIPTGEIAPVDNTPFDFRKSSSIGEKISIQNKQLEYGKGYDHNFVLNKSKGKALSIAAKAYDPQSGRVLEVKTTEPGIQFYSGNFLDGSDIGKEGKPYKYRTAFCLEPQHFPDSPNQPDFPSTILYPEEKYSSTSIFRLTTETKF